MRTIQLAILFIFTSCSVQKKISDVAERTVLNEPTLSSAHIGISVYDPTQMRYVYEHQSNKYFIPASNTKILTCYAAMKHLGDSVVAAYLINAHDRMLILPAGDPTLLHPDFLQQPLITALKNTDLPLEYFNGNWKEKALGFGWAWDDYESDYMAERSPLPIYGNVLRIGGKKDSLFIEPKGMTVQFQGQNRYINQLHRSRTMNDMVATTNGNNFSIRSIPFVTSDSITVRLLSEAIGKPIKLVDQLRVPVTAAPATIHSQHIDSLLAPMMHRSDNFFAEQTLLMVGHKIGVGMNMARTIDSVLNSDLKALPQRPKWVDGSGLSRYNLVSPNDMITVLDKMLKEFDWKRISTILPTGGEGTLSSYYKQYQGKIFAKTGTLSNNIVLSGYLLTNSGKKMIFSVLVNNHQAPTATIRKQVEELLGYYIEHY